MNNRKDIITIYTPDGNKVCSYILNDFSGSHLYVKNVYVGTFKYENVALNYFYLEFQK